MPNLTDADKVLRNDTGKNIVAKLDNIVNAIAGGNLSVIADAYDNTKTYAVGDYVIYGNALYKCITSVETAEDFDSSKWTEVEVTDEIPKSASDLSYDNTTSGLSATNTQSAIDEVEGRVDRAETIITNKMDKSNPTGTGSFSLNRKSGTTVGLYSFAEGTSTTASGLSSHAEGMNSQATAQGSHAEGTSQATAQFAHAEGNGVSSGEYSHAEGSSAASGDISHAEGNGTVASGDYSHAEGNGTVANHKSQHTFGEYNRKDTNSSASSLRGTYVEIVGNGTSNNDRSNARTLDWNGNEVLAGSLTSQGLTSPTLNGATIGNNPVFTDTQANWTESNTSSPAYIQNKPSIDTTVTSGSSNLITSGAVSTALENITPVYATGTLTAGQTSITISNNAITTNSIIEVFTDINGVNYTAISVSTGSVTLTYGAQSSNMNVKVRIS